MTAAARHKTHRKGDDFEYQARLRLKDGSTYVDLTGWSMTAEITRDGSTVVTLNTEIIDPQTGDDLGRFRVYYNDLTHTANDCVWVIKFTNASGIERTFIEGRFYFEDGLQ